MQRQIGESSSLPLNETLKRFEKNVKQYHISYSSLFNKGCYLCYFRKDRGTRDQIANICWIIKKGREFQKYIYFCFIDYAKAFNCVDHHKLWKILKEMEIPDHLTCLLWSLYAGQEATARIGHGTTDWFQINKGVHQGCIFSPCLFNFLCRVDHAKWWAGLSTRWKEVCWEKYQ